MLSQILAALAVAGLTAASLNPNDQQMLDSVNGTRQSAGVPAVCFSNKIVTASLPQTSYQAQHDTMTHDGTQDVGTRITSAGFNQAGAGECVGMANPDNFSAVYQAWVADPAHYQIIVNGQFTHLGWSKQQASSGAMYYTLDFAKAADPSEPCDGTSSGASSTASGQSSAQQPTSQATSQPTSQPAGQQSSTPQGQSKRQARRQQAYSGQQSGSWPQAPSASTPPPAANSMYGSSSSSSNPSNIGSDEDAQQNALVGQYEAQVAQLKAQVQSLQQQHQTY